MVVRNLVLCQERGRRVEVSDVVNGLPCRVVVVGVVLKNGVEGTLVFPALEDVTDRIGGSLPVERGLLDEFEKREAVLGLLFSSGGEPSGCNCELPEMCAVQTAIEPARERCARDDDEVVGRNLLVEIA